MPLSSNMPEAAPIRLLGMCQHTDLVPQLLQVFFLLSDYAGSVPFSTDL